MMKKISFFNKLVFSYIIIILTPLMMISFTYMYYYSNELKDNYAKIADTSMNDLSGQIGNIMNNVESFSLQMSFVSGLDNALKNPSNIDVYDYSVLKASIEDQLNTNNMFFSAYVYFKLNGTVLTTNEGFYNLSNFYDREFLQSLIKSKADSKWSGIRLVNSPELSNAEVISFCRTIPITEQYPSGDLVLNIKKEVFFEVLNKMNNDTKDGLLVLDSKKNLIFFNDKGKTVSKQFSDDILSGRIPLHSSITKINGIKYFLFFQKSQFNDWTIVDVYPYREYSELIKNKSFQLILSVLIVSCLGFLLAFIFAKKLYKPLRTILCDLGFSFHNGQKNDEYGIVSEAINKLIVENSSIKQSIVRNKSVIRNYLIREMLSGDVGNINLFEKRLQDNGIKLINSNYVVILVTANIKACEVYDDFSGIKLVLYGQAESMLQQTFVTLGTLLEKETFAFIINFDSIHSITYKENLLEICSAINESFKDKLGTSLLFYISPVCLSLKTINKTYLQLRNFYNYKSTTDDHVIIFMDDIKNHSNPDYPIFIQKTLFYTIRNGDYEGAHKAIEELFNDYICSSKFSYDKVQHTLLVLLGCVAGELVQENYNFKMIENINISEISDCNNKSELKEFITKFSDGLIVFFCNEKEYSVNNTYSHKATDFIENNYMNNFSISDIAEHINVSNSYLSRIFKAETGRSLLEFINEFRIIKSKDLLKNKNYTLNEISKLLGYNDVHSFIKFFKKYESITPGEFRKSLFMD